MRTGCSGSCREGRDPCTMPGTCGRPIVYPTRTPGLRGLLRRLWALGPDVVLWAVVLVGLAVCLAYQVAAVLIARG